MKILVYPIGKNPYQNLLYNELKKHRNVKVKYVYSNYIDIKHAFTIGMFIFPFRFLYYRLTGWNIIHLHWLSPFILPSKNIFMRYISTAYVISFLLYIKLLGYKLVWTLHEVLPHKHEFANDKLTRKIITKLCNAKIVHSITSLTEAKMLQYNTNNMIIIPHGNYNLSYKRDVSREKARTILKITKNNFVVLFFGMIKPYKGIDKLLETFESIVTKNKEFKLIIAGECTDETIRKLIIEYNRKYNKNLHLNLTHIKDEDVQLYFQACDIVALPFKENTTSGSAILSLSFAKPIVAPLIGSFKDLPRDVGYFYDPTNNEGLRNCIIDAIINKETLPELGENGLSYSNKLSWDKIADLTLNVFQKSLGNYFKIAIE